VIWLLVVVWVLGVALFAFSVWAFTIAAMRLISGRRRTRRIWRGRLVGGHLHVPALSGTSAHHGHFVGHRGRGGTA